MRLTKSLYYNFLDSNNYSNIADLMIEIDGVLVRMDDIPDSILREYYDFTKEELYGMIDIEINSGY